MIAPVEVRMTMDLVTALERTRALIATPEQWCQRDYQNEIGQFCLVGALCRVTGANCYEIWHTDAFRALETATGERMLTLSGWNDTHTHAEVLAAVDAAIQKAKETA
jgi:hypothetical protein